MMLCDGYLSSAKLPLSTLRSRILVAVVVVVDDAVAVVVVFQIVRNR